MIKKSLNLVIFLITLFLLFFPSLVYLKSLLNEKNLKKNYLLKEKSFILDKEFGEIRNLVCNYSLKNRLTINCSYNS